jgi:hypothetical protein
VCFECAPLELVERIATLCRRIRYRGVFVVEFIEDGDRALLLEFNARFYAEMGFGTARGMPLPILDCLAALGPR